MYKMCCRQERLSPHPLVGWFTKARARALDLHHPCDTDFLKQMINFRSHLTAVVSVGIHSYLRPSHLVHEFFPMICSWLRPNYLARRLEPRYLTVNPFPVAILIVLQTSMHGSPASSLREARVPFYCHRSSALRRCIIWGCDIQVHSGFGIVAV